MTIFQSIKYIFLHQYKFVATDHVTILKSSKLNKYNYLFISTILNRLQEKYNFNREINDERIRNEKILLPINDGGEPDYDFMEQYMREREQNLIQQYLNYINDK
ncbi:MAG: restriction endonuclease subunit S [Selenomonadaceae bacterium]|nr:restriction endonuclease subunit S [Selenomonadaceae bacterium]